MPRSYLGRLAVVVSFACTCAPALAGAQAPAPPEAQGDRARVETGTPGARTTPLARASQVTLRAERMSRRVAQLLDVARRDRDLRRVHCLNDTLSQINSALRAGQMRTRRLRRSAGGGDAAELRHETASIEALDARLSSLDDAARTCVGGEPTGPSGVTRVVVTVEPSTPREDPTRYGRPRADLPWVPPPASPLM